MRSFWLGRVVLSALVFSCGTLTSASAQSAPSPGPALTPAEIAIACAPPVESPGPSTLRLMAAQDPVPHTVFGNRELVVVNGGTNAGVQLGQQYYVRHAGRSMMNMGYSSSPAVRTAGWVRIVSVNDTLAIATVDYTCMEMTADDYLEPYAAPAPVVLDDLVADPDFTSLGRVVAAGYDRQIAAPGDFAVIDRGSEQGVAPNMRFAIYRDIGPKGAPLTAIGDVIVISVTKDRALTRIVWSNGVVLTNDYAAQRK